MIPRYVMQALRRRPTETFAAVVAVAISVAYLASVGSFVGHTGARLTTTAAERVPVDWQVQLSRGADEATLRKALDAVPGFAGARSVSYTRVPGLQSTSADGTRTTGSAYVVSLPADYASFAPGEVRSLTGASQGVLLQQQTATNLAATPGGKVQVLGGAKAEVTVAGIVDLPHADSFFQVVGAAPGTTPAAPPDNVLFVPPADFTALVRGDVVHQLHVRLDHASLPGDPARAADAVTLRANHYVASVAGDALIGDGLGAALTAAREDALYARLLVLLLGVPGLVLSAVVTGLIISLRNQRQRRDLALMRLRGVTPAASALPLGVIALLDGLLGAALGGVLAGLANRLALGPGTGLTAGWWIIAFLVGPALALVIELTPVANLLRGNAPTVNRQVVSGSRRQPLVLRLGLDVLLLAAAALVFWLTARGNYQVVVVPEGVPVATVNYAALLAPALAWPGLALLSLRIFLLLLGRRPKPARTDPKGRLTDLRKDVLRHRRTTVALGGTGVAVAVAVTVATAVFTATYDQQARVDVALSVGSDVAVTLPPDATATLDPAIAQVADVSAVEKVTHRTAYVGPDLQDLYGVDPATIGRAAPLLDAYTPGSSVDAVMRRLAATPDGVLLAQETLYDYQLHQGDAVRLRIQDAGGKYQTVQFHVVGVVTEFATAPRDSFVLANRSFLESRTGRSQVQTLLVRTDHPARVAARIQAPAGAVVDNITAPHTPVPSASGLAAGSLSGLARLGLGFGLVLAAAAAGLVLLVGVVQRRRSFVSLAVIGASARQRAGFVGSEALWVLLGGLLAGLAAGGVMAWQLVKVLTWIFDPPPEHPAVPGGFLLLTGLAVLGVGLAGTAGAVRWVNRADPSGLRDLE